MHAGNGDAPGQGSGGVGGSAGIIAPEPGLPSANGTLPCADDPTVCGAFQHGYCDAFSGGEAAEPTCRSGCVWDADCGPFSICECGNAESPTRGVCRRSDCTYDALCLYGWCASYSEVCGEGGFACHSPADECTVDSDCMGGACSWTTALGHRSCDHSVCGRP